MPPSIHSRRQLLRPCLQQLQRNCIATDAASVNGVREVVLDPSENGACSRQQDHRRRLRVQRHIQKQITNSAVKEETCVGKSAILLNHLCQAGQQYLSTHSSRDADLTCVALGDRSCASVPLLSPAHLVSNAATYCRARVLMECARVVERGGAAVACVNFCSFRMSAAAGPLAARKPAQSSCGPMPMGARC